MRSIGVWGPGCEDSVIWSNVEERTEGDGGARLVATGGVGGTG